jgi:hypothetical protein
MAEIYRPLEDPDISGNILKNSFNFQFGSSFIRRERDLSAKI